MGPRRGRGRGKEGEQGVGVSIGEGQNPVLGGGFEDGYA